MILVADQNIVNQILQPFSYSEKDFFQKQNTVKSYMKATCNKTIIILRAEQKTAFEANCKPDQRGLALQNTSEAYRLIKCRVESAEM